MRIKSYKARHPANFVRKIRSVTSECSAGRTDVRASARKVRYSATRPHWLVCAWYLRASVSTGPPTAGYHNARLEAGEVRCSRHRSLPCAASYENTACFWVCRRVRNVRGRKGLCRLRRRRPRACCLPCVESAMCSRAGPVGVSCPGLLSPPFRDSGSASPFLCLARTLLGQTFDQTTRRLQRFGWRF